MTPRMVERFARLGQYCVDAGADAILFTCSAFGEAINNLKTLQRIPILTPNQALFEELLQVGGKAAMLTTFTPSVQALRNELSDMAANLGIKPDVDSYMVEGALDELLAQRGPEHDRLIAQRVNGLSQYPTIVLGQFSMAQAALHPEVKTSARILTTPDCAVRKLKGLLGV
jgi:Asp/Glu/hydantoin racemase